MRLERFEMLDDLVEIDPAGGTARFRSRLPQQSPVFEGHFPGHALLPGVLMTEIVAQAAGFAHVARAGTGRMPILMAVDRARFRAPAAPGDRLDVHAWIDAPGGGYVAGGGWIEVSGRRVCEAALRFRLVENAAPFADFLRERAWSLGLPLPAAEAAAA